MSSGRLSLLLIALVCAAGCSKEGRIGSVAIVPADTRVSALDFDPGDRIGLSVVRTSGVYAENSPLVYDGAVFSGDLIWYAEREESSTLTAYFPYSESGFPVEFSVETDQRGGCLLSDLLGALRKDVVPGSAPVSMVFRHLMSSVTVVVNNHSAAAVEGVSFSGFRAVAEVDFSALEATAKSSAPPAEVRAFEEQPGLSYRAVLVPQSADLTVAVALDDGTVYRKTIASASLSGGHCYALTVDLSDDRLSLGLSGEITDWIDGGALGGSSDPVEGETLAYGGETYRTVTIGGKVWLAENLRFMPSGATVGSGVRYPAEGASGVAAKGLLYDRETALGVASADAESRVQGICPSGWHIPDRAELESLLTAGCGDDFFIPAGCWIQSIPNGKYGTNTYLMSATLSAAEGRMVCLLLSGSAASGLVDVPVNYGVSLRCVKN